MNILVIGNGFDLAHNLPTRYQDFISFIKQLPDIRDDRAKIESRNYLDDRIKQYLLYAKEKYRSDPYVEKMYNISKSKNVWKEIFDKECSEAGWIDFEKTIAEVLIGIREVAKVIRENYPSLHTQITNGNWYDGDQTNFEGSEKASRHLYKFFNTKQKKAFDTLKLLYSNKTTSQVTKEICTKAWAEDFSFWISELEKDLESLTKCLELYLDVFVNRQEISTSLLEIENLKIDYLINFNYTNTFERVKRYNQIKDSNYIHGIAKYCSNKNNLVLGIDEYLSEDEKNKDLELIRFKKYYQRLAKQTESKYNDWIYEIKQTPEIKHNVYIFGHSLDVTDKDILRDLILNDNVITTIFYHNQQAYEQQIINLVKLIGQEQLISKVTGREKTIIFKEQLNNLYDNVGEANYPPIA